MNKQLFIITLVCLIGAGIFLIQKNKYNLHQDDSVTFRQYADCRSKSTSIFADGPACTRDESFKKAFDNYQIYNDNNTQCDIFQDYVNQVQESKDYNNALLNKNDLYENCFANEKIRAIANSNECFFKNYYAPRILICGGLDKYAYPPYTSFDIKQ
ncbi:hypothetical protein ABPG74_001097 [Tetrahymena malaccensis]